MSKPVSNVAGGTWRLLAHRGDEPFEAADIGVFDELVVDEWLHVEQLDTNQWWLRVGDARILVRVTGDDQPAVVDVERGFYAENNGSTTIRE
jgi:hypothetical protein